MKKDQRDQCIHVHLTLGITDDLALLLLRLLARPDSSPELVAEIVRLKKRSDELKTAVGAAQNQ